MKIFPFKTALNTSTLIPFHLDVASQIKVAAEAGYDGIELWLDDIKKFLDQGGTVSELKKVLHSTGIEFVNTIAVFEWSDIDPNIRAHSLEKTKEDMKLLSDLGCHAIASPPYGNVAEVSLVDMANHFAKLVMMGREIGVEPYLEFWGKSSKLSKLSEAVYVLLESRVSDGKILIDPFHMHIGDSSFQGLEYINGNHIGIFHVNDYPSSSAKETLEDKDRVFPGEGIAPSKDLAQTLYQNGFEGYLSLELFREQYANMAASDIATYGLECIKNEYKVSTSDNK